MPYGLGAQSKSAYNSLFVDIMSTKNESDNHLEGISLNLEKITRFHGNTRICNDNIQNLLMNSSFKQKMVFLVLYQYHWLKTNQPHNNPHLNLCDLKQFLIDQQLLDYEKLGHLLDYSHEASDWLMKNTFRSKSGTNEIDKMHKKLLVIQNSIDIRRALDNEGDFGDLDNSMTGRSG
jgi:hypothetical protein